MNASSSCSAQLGLGERAPRTVGLVQELQPAQRQPELGHAVQARDERLRIQEIREEHIRAGERHCTWICGPAGAEAASPAAIDIAITAARSAFITAS